MNTRRVCRGVVVCLLLSGFFAGSAKAQSRGTPVRASTAHGAVGTGYTGPMNEVLKIRRVEGLARSNLVRTPEFRHNLPGGTKPTQEWVEIKTTFDTSPEWIDEVVFQYYVLTYSRKEKEGPYSFYQASVRYGDVEKGRNHLSTMYIPPSAVKRYGFPVAIGVEVSVNGKVVDVVSDRDNSVRVDDGWWKNPNVIGKEAVIARQGCLLNRKESPFALVNIDDHEVIR
jgi:hypothetical protein